MLSQERKETIDKIDELSEQTALAIVKKLNLNHITIDDIKNVS